MISNEFDDEFDWAQYSRNLKEAGFPSRPMPTKAELLQWVEENPIRLPALPDYEEQARDETRLLLLEAVVHTLAERETLPEHLVRQVVLHLDNRDMEGPAILALLDQAPDEGMRYTEYDEDWEVQL